MHKWTLEEALCRVNFCSPFLTHPFWGAVDSHHGPDLIKSVPWSGSLTRNNPAFMFLMGILVKNRRMNLRELEPWRHSKKKEFSFTKTDVFGLVLFPHARYVPFSGGRNRHPGHNPEPSASVCAALGLPAAPQQTLLHHPPQAAQTGPHQCLPGTAESRITAYVLFVFVICDTMNLSLSPLNPAALLSDAVRSGVLPRVHHWYGKQGKISGYVLKKMSFLFEHLLGPAEPD